MRISSALYIAVPSNYNLAGPKSTYTHSQRSPGRDFVRQLNHSRAGGIVSTYRRAQKKRCPPPKARSQAQKVRAVFKCWATWKKVRHFAPKNSRVIVLKCSFEGCKCLYMCLKWEYLLGLVLVEVRVLIFQFSLLSMGFTILEKNYLNT